MSRSRDQKRRKKLAEREKRRAEISVELTLPRDKIAAAVHQAVCTFAQDDGFGHCAHYAFAGSKLVSLVTGKLYLPQAGDLQVFCDGDDGIMMDASRGVPLVDRGACQPRQSRQAAHSARHGGYRLFQPSLSQVCGGTP